MTAPRLAQVIHAEVVLDLLTHRGKELLARRGAGVGAAGHAAGQGLTLVHFSAQLKRFMWDGGCIQGSRRGRLGGVRGYHGVSILCQ